MVLKRSMVLAAATWLLAGAVANAQDADGSNGSDDSLDVTMTLLPEGASLPDAVTRTIPLPDTATSSHAQPGLDTANENRLRRDDGLETAQDARDRGRQFGQDVRDQAAEQRENAERGQRPDGAGPPDGLPPTSPPDQTSPPDLPDQANPPGPPSS
jgi:hypothetical protein